MKLYALFGLALIAGLALSCNNTSHSSELAVADTAKVENLQLKDESTNKPEEENRKELVQNVPAPPPSPKIPHQSPIPLPMDWEKKIVRNAELTMEVKDFGSAGKLIKTAVQLNGGYIAGSNEQQLSNQIRADVTIKVPREKFDELLERIPTSGDSLLQKQITSEDFTEEFVDTKARIRAKEKVRERYYEFLKKAGTIKDVLAVEADLRELDEEIESATGRTNYINHEAALNTIHLVYFQMLTVPAPPDVAPGFTTELLRSFRGGLDFLKEILLVLVGLWPLALAIVFVIWAFRRQKKAKLPTVIATANASQG